MNPQMRMVVMLGVLWAGGSMLYAAERPAPPAAAEPAGKPAAPPSAQAEAAAETDSGGEAEAAAEEDQDPAPKRSTAAANDASSPQRFTPSEQVRADFDVSFPIDI